MFFKGLCKVPARGSFCQSSLSLLLVFVSGSCSLAEVNRALRVGQNLSYNAAAVVTCDSRGTGLKEQHTASMNFGYTKGAVLWCGAAEGEAVGHKGPFVPLRAQSVVVRER